MAFFYFDTLCQLAYMVYITNANAKINSLSITSREQAAGNISYLLLTIHFPDNQLPKFHHSPAD